MHAAQTRAARGDRTSPASAQPWGSSLARGGGRACVPGMTRWHTTASACARSTSSCRGTPLRLARAGAWCQALGYNPLLNNRTASEKAGGAPASQRAHQEGRFRDGGHAAAARGAQLRLQPRLLLQLAQPLLPQPRQLCAPRQDPRGPLSDRRPETAAPEGSRQVWAHVQGRHSASAKRRQCWLLQRDRGARRRPAACRARPLPRQGGASPDCNTTRRRCRRSVPISARVWPARAPGVASSLADERLSAASSRPSASRRTARSASSLRSSVRSCASSCCFTRATCACSRRSRWQQACSAGSHARPSSSAAISSCAAQHGFIAWGRGLRLSAC